MPDTRLLRLGQFELFPTRLDTAGTPTLEDYDAVLQWLRQAHSGVQWWVGDALNALDRDYPDQYSQLVDASEWQGETVRVYRWVCASVLPVNRLTDVPFGHYVNGIAALPPGQQAEWTRRVVDEKLSRSGLSTALRLAKRAETYAAQPLPADVFRIIYADPPWQYDDAGVIVPGDAYGRAERHYPTLSIDDLCAMPVGNIAAADAVLFLWVTSPLLLRNPGPRDVIDSWGFNYKTSMVWDKVAHNYGHYVSVRHEHLLICTRGSCTPDQPTPMPDSVYTERRSDVHSQKPTYFRTLIDHLYPHGNALELFSRQPSEGRWTCYGNQLSSPSEPYDPRDVAILGGDPSS